MSITIKSTQEGKETKGLEPLAWKCWWRTGREIKCRESSKGVWLPGGRSDDEIPCSELELDRWLIQVDDRWSGFKSILNMCVRNIVPEGCSFIFFDVDSGSRFPVPPLPVCKRCSFSRRGGNKCQHTSTLSQMENSVAIAGFQSTRHQDLNLNQHQLP